LIAVISAVVTSVHIVVAAASVARVAAAAVGGMTGSTVATSSASFRVRGSAVRMFVRRTTYRSNT
jgi:hypothetical protein